MAAGWIEPLAEALADARAFRGWALRGAQRNDEDFLFALHRDAMRAYVDATWGWDEEWQRAHFAANYAPERQAVIVHGGTVLRDVGRISLTRHWCQIALAQTNRRPRESGDPVAFVPKDTGFPLSRE